MEIIHPWALVAFSLYILIILGITVYSARIMARTKVGEYVDEFYTAGRGFGGVIIAFMIAAGLCSAGTFIGGPGLIWKLGLAFALVGMAQLFMNLYVLGTFGAKIAIISRRVNARSLVDIFFHRYEKNKAVVIGVVAAIVIFLGFYCSAMVVGGGRVIEVMTGFPYHWGLLLYAAIVVLYTTFGGLRGTAIAILVQGIVMTIATAILVVAGIIYAGGVAAMFNAMLARSPDFLTPVGTAHVSFKWIFSLWVTFGIAIAVLPHAIMGSLVYKSTRAAKRAIIIGAVVVFLWTALLTILSAIAGAVVHPELAIPDYNLPALALVALPPAVAGIVLAGIAAAVQSTVGIMLMVISAALVSNIYQGYFKPSASPDLMKKVTRGATAAVGIIVFALAFTAPPMLEYIVIFCIGGLASAFFAPLFGLFWPRANQYGAIAGIYGGIITYILAKQFVKSITLGMDPIVIAIVVSGILFVGVSLLTPKPSRETLQLFWGKTKA